MFRHAGRGFARKGVELKPFDVPSANGSLGAPGHLRRQTNVRLTSTAAVRGAGMGTNYQRHLPQGICATLALLSRPAM